MFQSSQTNPPAPYEPRDPTTRLSIRHFKLIKQVGSGGYSRVYQAYRLPENELDLYNTDPIYFPTEAEEKVPEGVEEAAIKVIHKARYFRTSNDVTSKPLVRAAEHFTEAIWSERKIWIAASCPIPSPYVLPLNHLIQDRNTLYYILPFISGGDLDLVIRQRGPMNEPTARYYAAQIILAFEHLHSRGIVYKDIKLKNLLLDGDGKLKLTDFGLSRIADPKGNFVTTGVPGRAGTKSYKSPEMLYGNEHSFPTDFYSLGVVLFKLLTGFKLYHTDDAEVQLPYLIDIPKYYHYLLSSTSRWSFSPTYHIAQGDELAHKMSPRYIDGVGPIFGRKHARAVKQEVLKMVESPHDDVEVDESLWNGEIRGREFYLSLSDEAVDFLKQIVDLNPYYRLGTHNRLQRDTYDYESVPQNGRRYRGSSDDAGTIHTLLSTQSFNFHRDVQLLAAKRPHDAHSFEVYNIEMVDDVPTLSADDIEIIRGKDENGLWRGYHSGFVEIKNHPWFRGFDWDHLTETNVNLNKFNCISTVDVRTHKRKYVVVPPPEQDAVADDQQKFFKGIEFNDLLDTTTSHSSTTATTTAPSSAGPSSNDRS